MFKVTTPRTNTIVLWKPIDYKSILEFQKIYYLEKGLIDKDISHLNNIIHRVFVEGGYLQLIDNIDVYEYEWLLLYLVANSDEDQISGDIRCENIIEVVNNKINIQPISTESDVNIHPDMIKIIEEQNRNITENEITTRSCDTINTYNIVYRDQLHEYEKKIKKLKLDSISDICGNLQYNIELSFPTYKELVVNKLDFIQKIEMIDLDTSISQILQPEQISELPIKIWKKYKTAISKPEYQIPVIHFIKKCQSCNNNILEFDIPSMAFFLIKYISRQ